MTDCVTKQVQQLQDALRFPFSIFGDALDQGTLMDSVHGTSVAGLAAAYGNNALGIRGVAPLAKLVGYRISGLGLDDDGKRFDLFSVEDLPAALFDPLHTGYIYNASIGLLPGKGEEKIRKKLEQGAEAGGIYVFMAGNEAKTRRLNTNYSRMTNTRFGITVGAFLSNGEPAEYSTPGTTVLISVPVHRINFDGKLVEELSTTDVIGEGGYNSDMQGKSEDYPDRNYTKFFGGTSAATPVVAGVIALMRQAQPELTWRDIQQILILSAKPIFPGHLTWINDQGIFPYSLQLGFGGIDAEKAVEMAKTWTPVGAPQSAIGRRKDAQTNTMEVDKNVRIESVELFLTAATLEDVTLMSPLKARSYLVTQENVPLSNARDWGLTSVRHFGEPSQGDWQLEVLDQNSNPVKDVKWRLQIHGTELPTWNLETATASTCEHNASGGVVCTFSDGSGSVLLQPTNVERPDLQYVFLAADDAESFTHNGTYWFPTPADDESAYGINLNITMDVNPAWLPLPTDQQTTQTVSAPVCSAMSPPEPLDVQKTLRWTLSAAAQEHACTLSLTWEDTERPGQPLTAPITLTFQDPTGACQSQLLAPATDTVDVLARYSWKEQDTTYLASTRSPVLPARGPQSATG